MNQKLTLVLVAVFSLMSLKAVAGSPAARLGDSTSQGGVIAAGLPTVLIGSMPAARATDFAGSPLVLPGPVPCVGGPILPSSSPTVLIGSLPAARLGDQAVTACGPQVITTGDFTVLIGP